MGSLFGAEPDASSSKAQRQLGQVAGAEHMPPRWLAMRN